jgi:hypothetical protein
VKCGWPCVIAALLSFPNLLRPLAPAIRLHSGMVRGLAALLAWAALALIG